MTSARRPITESQENLTVPLSPQTMRLQTLLRPPKGHLIKEEDLLRKFNKLVEEDGKIVISRSNLNELHKVLEENEMSCMDLLHVNTDGLILTKQKLGQG
uniref:Uncharacterized protein n=1 Tax=Salix viminalis TaxID=40686 RepID=A0A6N2M129_SALVM